MGVDGIVECTVEDIASPVRNAVVGGPFGSDLVSLDYVSSGVPVIRGTNLGKGRWVAGEFAFVTPEKAHSLSANCAKPGDLVFTQRGTLGQVALVPRNGPERYLVSQSQMKLTVDPSKADALFLYYVFTSREQQDYILKNAIQTGVPHTNLGIFRRTPLSLLPLDEQRIVASILGALDDKIELNRRMNATLEAMARALFQSWFVDFDPVRAKLDGRQPAGLNEAAAELFPASFQSSSLGDIPVGWKVGSVLWQADLLSGGTPKTENPAYWNGDVPWASAKDVSQCGEAFLIATERAITKLGVKESSTKIIPALSTVVVARGATTGRLAMLGEAMAMNQTCYGLRSKIGAPFSLYCQTKNFIDRLVQGCHGSIFDTITTSTFEATEVLLPPDDVLLDFNSQVSSIFHQVHANLHQSNILAALRDTLLPKLLSGELSVKSAERQIA